MYAAHPRFHNSNRQDSPRDVVILSTADWDNPFWTNKQHVAAQLAAVGHRVLYMESLGLRRPCARGRDLARMAARLGRAWAGARQVRPNLWVVSPLALPWHGRGAGGLNRVVVARQVAAAARRLGFVRPLVWVYNPLTVDWLEALSPAAILYHCVDELGAIPGVSAPVILAAEARLCRRADVVVATSPSLAERLGALAPGRVHLLPNVVDYDHFARARAPVAPPADLARIPHPRLGFVGALAEYKVDLALIDAVAALRPDWHWVLIGQVGEGQPDAPAPSCLSRPNVHLLGPRPYEDLPSYLGGFDVAVLPMCRNAYTAAMFPMKFFEYLAAGLPVVSTPLPALAAHAPLFRSAHGALAFAATLADVLAGQCPDPIACDAAARAHSWEWRMAEMVRLVERSSPSAD
jgi:glycosyltransferase involved in cell wall biosynthesis